VADLRAPTPTAAAELAVPARDELLAVLGQVAQRLQVRVAHRLESQAQRLDRLALQLARPSQALAQARAQLQALEHRRARAIWRALETRRLAPQGLRERLVRATAAALHTRGAHLAALGGRLASLDPSQVLARGYAFVRDAQAKPVTSARAVQAGQALTLQWHDGAARTRVEGVD
jgi:exodeoxyribonuclease VII large subunit